MRPRISIRRSVPWSVDMLVGNAKVRFSLHFSLRLFISPHFSSFLFISLHFSSFLFISLHVSSCVSSYISLFVYSCISSCIPSCISSCISCLFVSLITSLHLSLIASLHLSLCASSFLFMSSYVTRLKRTHLLDISWPCFPFLFFLRFRQLSSSPSPLMLFNVHFNAVNETVSFSL